MAQPITKKEKKNQAEFRKQACTLVLVANQYAELKDMTSRVPEFLTNKSWKFQGKDEKMEMDSFRNKKNGKKVFVEDISENFPVTFLMGELSVLEFSIIASELTLKSSYWKLTVFGKVNRRPSWSR